MTNEEQVLIRYSTLTMRIPFTKMVGTGNDFILVDAIRQRLNGVRLPQLARQLCKREGTDGLLVLDRSRTADVRMRIFNPDGSEPTMCGNGIRCLAWYASRTGATGKTMSIQTGAGIKQAHMVGSNRVRIDMGRPRYLRHLPEVRVPAQHGVLVEADWIDSGVPHLVCWVGGVSAIDVARIGRRLRRDRRFAPGGTNVDFATQVGPTRTVHDARRRALVSRVTLRVRTYERGVEAETQACGTGAVAAAAAFARIPLRVRYIWHLYARVLVPGGQLRVQVTSKCSAGSGRRRVRRLVYGPAFLEGDARQLKVGTVTWNGRG